MYIHSNNIERKCLFVLFSVDNKLKSTDKAMCHQCQAIGSIMIKYEPPVLLTISFNNSLISWRSSHRDDAVNLFHIRR